MTRRRITTATVIGTAAVVSVLANTAHAGHNLIPRTLLLTILVASPPIWAAVAVHLHTHTPTRHVRAATWLVAAAAFTLSAVAITDFAMTELGLPWYLAILFVVAIDGTVAVAVLTHTQPAATPVADNLPIKATPPRRPARTTTPPDATIRHLRPVTTPPNPTDTPAPPRPAQPTTQHPAGTANRTALLTHLATTGVWTSYADIATKTGININTLKTIVRNQGGPSAALNDALTTRTDQTAGR